MNTTVAPSNLDQVVSLLVVNLVNIEKQFVSTLTDRPEGLEYVKAASQYDAQGVITAKATLTSEGIKMDVSFVHDNVPHGASEIAQRFIFESVFATHVQQLVDSLGFA